MKLLFDHNLSYALVGSLADVYPGSEHVRDVGLHRADDSEVWEYARANALAIVSMDEDFHELSVVHGPRPKVVWVRLGDWATSDIEPLLRVARADLLEFDAAETGAFLMVGEQVL